MRFLKLTNAKNPDDYILLNGGYFDKDANKIKTFNGFSGFLCTSFQSLGIKRKLEFLKIKNRQFSVSNEPEFDKYSLIIEILSKYSEYEVEYRKLITFLDKNKKDGFRLYYKPYDGINLRYCLCDIESSTKTGKMQPITLLLTQLSLWFEEKPDVETAQSIVENENMFAFVKDDNIKVYDKEGNEYPYYSAGFYFDEDTSDYCIEFFSGVLTEAIITNNSYNEIPLNIKIYGPCSNPFVSLFRKGEGEAIMNVQLFANINKGYYIEINSNINENGVWLVNEKTGEKRNYIDLLDNSQGSPYFYINNGDYVVRVVDEGNNACLLKISYKEEYSE